LDKKEQILDNNKHSTRSSAKKLDNPVSCFGQADYFTLKQQIKFVSVPMENNYVNQFVIATCTSSRHLVSKAGLLSQTFNPPSHLFDVIRYFYYYGSDWI